MNKNPMPWDGLISSHNATDSTYIIAPKNDYLNLNTNNQMNSTKGQAQKCDYGIGKPKRIIIRGDIKSDSNK